MRDHFSASLDTLFQEEAGLSSDRDGTGDEFAVVIGTDASGVWSGTITATGASDAGNPPTEVDALLATIRSQ